MMIFSNIIHHIPTTILAYSHNNKVFTFYLLFIVLSLSNAAKEISAYTLIRNDQLSGLVIRTLHCVRFMCAIIKMGLFVW